MNDTEGPPKVPEELQSPSDETVARLLRLAGPRPAVPEVRAARVRGAAHAHWRKTVRSGRKRRAFVWAAATLSAAAALTLGIGLSGWRPLHGLFHPTVPIATLERSEGSVEWPKARPFTVGQAIPPGTWLQTGRKGRAALILAGGASLRVDEQTRLRLISKSILQLEQGAVYVDTGPKAGVESPVEVRTRLGEVRDSGTQFEVRLEGTLMRVSVREGIATLTRAGRPYPAPAGTRLSLDASGAVATDTIPLQGSDWDWVLNIAPTFALEGRTLGEFLDWVSRETRWEVRFSDAVTATRTSAIVLHGSVEGLRPDETPATVLPTCGLRPRVVGNTLFVEPANGLLR